MRVHAAYLGDRHGTASAGMSATWRAFAALITACISLTVAYWGAKRRG